MILKTYPDPAPINKPQVGDLKYKNFFAWWPTKVDNQLIWLHKWRKCFEYRLISQKEWDEIWEAISNGLTVVYNGEVVRHPIKPYHPKGEYGWMFKENQIKYSQNIAP